MDNTNVRTEPNGEDDNPAQNQTIEVGDLVKSKVETYNIETAVGELEKIINESSELYHDLKKVKFNYLVQTCELYSRIDLPSIMMETCRKEINQNVPKAKNINKMDF